MVLHMVFRRLTRLVREQPLHPPLPPPNQPAWAALAVSNNATAVNSNLFILFSFEKVCVDNVLHISAYTLLIMS